MKQTAPLLFSSLGAGILAIGVIGASAYDDRGKAHRGCAYFDKVCSTCHVKATGKIIPTDSRTKEQWREYLSADKHDASGASNPSVRYYISRQYRESIQFSNKAARKLLKMSDEELLICLQDFLILGARDADRPLPRYSPARGGG